MPVVFPTATAMLMAERIASDTTSWTGATAHLYQNNVAITPAVTAAQLQEATFSGYEASATISWSGPGSDPAGNGYMFSNLQPFISSSTTTTNTIYGGYLLGQGSDSTSLLLVEPFATPINIAGPGQFVDWSPQLIVPGPGSSPLSGP